MRNRRSFAEMSLSGPSDASDDGGTGSDNIPKEHSMSIAITPFLRNALLVDALASGATAILLVAGTSILEPLLGF